VIGGLAISALLLAHQDSAEELILRLGDESPQIREKAEEDLIGLGVKILQVLERKESQAGTCQRP